MPTSTICPACGREAPIVYKGVVPCCTACGALRAPLSSASVNMAGKPSRVGGTFAVVLGWVVLALGGSTALGVVLLLLALSWPAGALAIGLPIALVTLITGVLLVKSGRSLQASGADAERETRTQALLAMAAQRGAVTAREAAQALSTSVAEADAMLTELAKRDPERVAVDVDDQGVLWYRVAPAPGEPIPRMRVEPEQAVRVDTGGANETENEGEDEQGRRAARAPR
ncbi:MAG TPA: hypothetical protein VMI75_09135 [Polyangiaceae bacterium]|nr:hypothetical protein [Polyangiaceae bacterium]